VLSVGSIPQAIALRSPCQLVFKGGKLVIKKGKRIDIDNKIDNRDR
jgi:hypothetical protein